MNKTLHTIVALVLAATLPSPAQQPPGRPGGPGRPEQMRLPEGTRTERDLVYGSVDGRELKLNLYLPPGDEAKPLIIWIHGGAWMMGSKDGPSPAQQFVASGYAIAHVGYRLSQVAKWPAQMHDCKAAVRWLRANAGQYHLDPKRFAVWGSSAGGHLVAVLGTSGGVPELEGTGNDLKTSSSVQAVVDWFGPTDFLQMSKFRSNIAHDEARSPESQLIGGPIQENKDATAKANPITYVGRGEAPPPFLIMHGTRDDLVPFNQSELLNDALKAAKADVTFSPVNGAGHGFGGEQNIAPVREFLTRVLGPASPAKGTSPRGTDGEIKSNKPVRNVEPANLRGVEGKPVKVLVIGRSEFGSGGTLGKAIQAWGKADGMVYAEVDQGKEFGYGDYISYKPILERKLATEKFDYVLLSMHNECWSQRRPEDLIAAAADCHAIITKHGAKTMLYMLFNGPKSPPVETVVPLYERAFQAMRERMIDGKNHEVLYIPGLLLSEASRAKEQTGRSGGPRATGWEQGGIHPTELGQYAYGCLIYTFISGKDPHQIAFKTGVEETDAKWIWDNVWSLYNKRLKDEGKP